MSERNQRFIESEVASMKEYTDLQYRSVAQAFRELESMSSSNISSPESSFDFETVNLVKDFCKRAAHAFYMRLWESLREIQESKTPLPESVKSYFLDKQWDYPHFDIYDAYDGLGWIRTNGLNINNISKEAVVVVFNLPKPLAYFWFKGGNRGKKAFEGTQDVGSAGIAEWGKLYRDALPAIWSEVRFEDAYGELELKRINKNFQHNKKHYYYVWVATKQQ